jgi:Skp family chaperone for outer membrane proteins
MTNSICKTAASVAATFLLSSTVFGDNSLRIATVDMQSLFKDYHRTAEAQKELNVERARIQQNNQTRLEVITSLEKELAAMRKQLDDPALSDLRKQEVFKGLQAKTQEGVAVDRERREFLQRRNTALNEKMMLKMKGILEEVRKIVAAHAQQADFDYVFDRAGLSTSQVPFLLYAKDAADLTPILLKELNKDAPRVSDPSEPTAQP